MAVLGEHEHLDEGVVLQVGLHAGLDPVAGDAHELREEPGPLCLLVVTEVVVQRALGDREDDGVAALLAEIVERVDGDLTDDGVELDGGGHLVGREGQHGVLVEGRR